MYQYSFGSATGESRLHYFEKTNSGTRKVPIKWNRLAMTFLIVKFTVPYLMDVQGIGHRIILPGACAKSKLWDEFEDMGFR